MGGEEGNGIDMDKLTRRQRMTLLQKQNLGQRGQFSAMQQLDRDGNVIDQSLQSGSNHGDLEDFSEGLPLKATSRRLPKTQISQAAADEAKRKQLTIILKEQHDKMQERQNRLKGIGTGDAKAIGGTLGRYVQHNTKQSLQKPGMEQFAISIKLRYKDDGALGHQLCFPKGVMLPECINQKKSQSVALERAVKAK